MDSIYLINNCIWIYMSYEPTNNGPNKYAYVNIHLCLMYEINWNIIYT